MIMLSLGEDALLIRLGDVADADSARRSHALADRLRRASLAGVTELVPAAASVAVFFNASQTTHEALAAAIRASQAMTSTAPAATGTSPSAPRLHTIPVIYDGADLVTVAETTGLSPAEVIARHAARTYTVYAVGFVPGFGYLGDLDPSLALPRRVAPRPRVPAGSVAIAGLQTAVYPLETPGGWHLIGRTLATMFDPATDPPARLAVGDAVQFVVSDP